MSHVFRPSVLAFAAATLFSSSAFTAETEVIEFYNTQLKHYFITNPAEAAMIDSGSAGAGWVRTGQTFAVAGEGAPGATQICRFYTPGANSHVYAHTTECDALKSSNPSNILHPDLWKYEGIVFHSRAPANAACPTGTQPVFRLYNNRFAQRDSNHRFTTQTAIRDQMVAQGWKNEGIALCASTSSSGSAFRQDVSGYVDTVLGFASGDVADMDTLGLILASALQGLADPTWTCPAATSNPPLQDLSAIPANLAINFTYGNGCTLQPGTTMAGSGNLNVTNIVVTDTALRANISTSLNNIRLNGTTVASGGLNGALNLTIDPATEAISGTVNATLNNLLLAGGTGGNGNINVTIQPSGGILLSTNLTTVPAGTPVRLNLSAVPQSTGALIVNTTGTGNSVGSYGLQANNLVYNPNVCESYPVGGQLIFSQSGQTGTVTFNNACNGSYSYVGP